MNKLLVPLAIAGLLLTGCGAETEAAPETQEPVSVESAPEPTWPELSMGQLSELNDGLRAMDSDVSGTLDEARAVCLQIADGAHGEGFHRGVAMRFGVAETDSQAVLDLISDVGVCG